MIPLTLVVILCLFYTYVFDVWWERDGSIRLEAWLENRKRRRAKRKRTQP